MKIIVCIKQVPETTEVRIDPETNTLVREGVASIINPFDMYAIEEGIRLRERFGGRVFVITMGPPQAERALREALAMGCDEAFLISDRAFAGSDTWATSYVLSKAIRSMGDFDLIICGKQASDGDTAQVGPGISTHLRLPQGTFVKKIEELKIEESNGSHRATELTIQRMTEAGYERIRMPLPALITVVKEINTPRMASLKGLLHAKKAQIVTMTAKDIDVDPADCGLNGSPTRVIKTFTPPPRKRGQMIEGEPQEVAHRLAEILRSCKL